MKPYTHLKTVKFGYENIKYIEVVGNDKMR